MENEIEEEIEITPIMIRMGVRAFALWDQRVVLEEEGIARIYRAMERVRRRYSSSTPVPLGGGKSISHRCEKPTAR